MTDRTPPESIKKQIEDNGGTLGDLICAQPNLVKDLEKIADEVIKPKTLDDLEWFQVSETGEKCKKDDNALHAQVYSKCNQSDPRCPRDVLYEMPENLPNKKLMRAEGVKSFLREKFKAKIISIQNEPAFDYESIEDIRGLYKELTGEEL